MAHYHQETRNLELRRAPISDEEMHRLKYTAWVKSEENTHQPAVDFIGRVNRG
jgi:hypothetical protein